MICQKKIFLGLTGLVLAVSGLFSQPLLAFQKEYFDYGPYYPSSQVLGFSLSNLENLPALALPNNLNLPQATGILPDSPFYPLEQMVETAQLIFTFDPVKKESLRLEIAYERLSEAKTLMDQGKTGAASEALDDYGKTLTAITDNLPILAQTNTAEVNNLLTQIEEGLSAQTVVAAALSLTTTPAQAEGWTEAGNATRAVLDKVAQARGESPIPQNLSTSIQQLKQEGLITEEESNKLYSLGSRSEVRDELVKLTTSGGLPPSEMLKLDVGLEKYYPEVQKQQITNFQVLELKGYQSLPQPSEKTIEKLTKWQEDSSISPSNDIKPYLWYNRAQNLAREVDLSNFSPPQQADLAKLYPAPLLENPTYTPPSPSPSPSVTPPPSTGSGQAAAPTAQPTNQPSPSPSTPPAATPYLQDAEGVLPGQPTYILKRFGEEAGFFFTLDQAEKVKIRMQHAERRLAEAQALSSDPQKASVYESTLKSYQNSLAEASNRIKNLPDQAAQQAAEQLEAQAGRHEVVFEKGLLPAPPKNPQLVANIIKTTEDAMDKSADVLDRPALPPLLASRLDDLKAQGLILAEEAQDLVNSSSREEVRGKIRKLVELNTFPLADAKKLDEAQTFSSPADYNQLVEVRKIEELQNLRAVQTDLAQTPTLKAQATTLGQKEITLTSSFDLSLIKPEDLAGRENLVKTYEKLSSVPRPINGGQFGAEATPGAQPSPSVTPSPRDAVLSTCPEGATFKQFEGCVWADSGRKINDYDQYKCDGPRQYYSFAARKCVAYDPTKGYQEDAQPICPVGYIWSWQNQSCQTSTGGILPWPSPSPEPEPTDEKEIEERSKLCPEGSSYKVPEGCVWDENGKSVHDPEQYRCGGRGQYYSFEAQKCVAAPKPGESYPDDSTPTCKEAGTYWKWSEGRCVVPTQPQTSPSGAPAVMIDDIRPNFVTPDSPFYFLKQAGERAQQLLAFTPQNRERVSLAQAKERLAEAADALKRNDQAVFKKSIDSYTSMMQNIVSDVSKQQLSEGARKEIGKILSESSVEQNLLLEKLQAWAPKEQDTPLSAAVSVTILGVDKAADIAGEPAIPDEVKSKIESLPEDMISEEDKKKLLEIDSRVDARLKLGSLIQNGALTQTEAGFLNEDFDMVDQNAKLKVEELKKLEEIATASENKDKLIEKVTKNEEIAQKLAEFERTFEAGKEIPAEIRPYVRLTRINEVAQTVRPDIVKLEDFQNRKDVLLAIATLQEEFRPTKEAFQKVEEFRRKNPNAALPLELARIEALSFSLGVRGEAGPCFLPTPPFPANTPCPAPGAAIPITSYVGLGALIVDPFIPGKFGPGWPDSSTPSTDKDGKPFVYGQGPKPENAGVCPNGYHWMYDSGGWCMSNSGNYNSSYGSTYTPSGPTTSGYTPYSPYYTAPGAYPATSGYPGGAYSYSYSAPSYYGSAPTYYTTNPPSGTVPGSGPKPTAPGQCPSGFHWMSDSGGWCMANSNTYVPPGTPDYPTGTATTETGSYNCGSQPYDPVTKKCKDGACPGGFYWEGSKCVAGYYLPGTPGGSSSGGSTPWCWSAFLSPEATTCSPGSSWDASSCSCKSSGGGVNCGSGYWWNGYSCQPSAGSGSSCTYPSGGCPGTGAWYDYSSCSCKTTTYSNNNSSCSPPSGGCGSGWFDYGTCSCKTSSSSGCYNVSASSCGSGWYFDSSACTCRQPSTSTNTGTSSGSCPSGSHWMSENGGYCMSDSSSTSSSGSSGSTSGSCPSGYHWMDNSWCMADGGSSSTTTSGGSTTTEPTPAPSTSTTTSSSSEPTPAPSTSTTTESPPPPSTESTPSP